MKSQRSISTRVLPLLAAVGALYGLASLPAQASSHREAPSLTESDFFSILTLAYVKECI